MREGLDAYKAYGAGVTLSAFLGDLHSIHEGKAAQGGLEVLGEAYAALRQSGERWWMPEIHRIEVNSLSSFLSLSIPPLECQKKTEECFICAINLAAEQKAKLLELRALMSLHRLAVTPDERAHARRQLLEARDWFTEGYESPDLIDAARLIGNL